MLARRSAACAYDRSKLSDLFATVGFEAVFHMAANSDIAAGVSDFRLDLELNQLTTINVIEAMQAHKVWRLFFASTSAIFGETDAVLREDFAPLQPISFSISRPRRQPAR